MSESLIVDGFKSSQVFQQIADGLASQSSSERKATVGKVKGIFQMEIKPSSGPAQSWTLNFKDGEGEVYKGKVKSGKADATILVSDDDFMKMASGELNGQKAFMSQKIRIKGQMMLATKLDAVLKSAKVQSKL
ncbi:MAG: sterol-binding-like protein [Piptocephalis tieghemiana]|nr:MAG: sterol-binding-like protein [Piptocephalis tieghemiana]